MKISQRFLSSTIGAMALVTSISFIIVFQHLQESFVAAEQRELQETYEIAMSMVDAKGAAAETLSALVAGIPRVRKAFADGDRETLISYFSDHFASLKKDYGTRQFQFHLPPATSFLRVHKPARFGDDLSAFRHTVVETNASRKPIRGLEIGVAGLGVRGMVPVFHDGKHLGSVEFGMSFGQSFSDEFSRQHAVRMSLHLKRDSGLEPFVSTMGQQHPLATETLDTDLSG